MCFDEIKGVYKLKYIKRFKLHWSSQAYIKFFGLRAILFYRIFYYFILKIFYNVLNILKKKGVGGILNSFFMLF